MKTFPEENQIELFCWNSSLQHARSVLQICVQPTGRPSDNWSQQHNMSNFRLRLLSCFDKLGPIQFFFFSQFVIQDFKSALSFVQKLA